METHAGQLLLHDQNRVGKLPVTIVRSTDEEAFHGVRCPLCDWRPDASSRWRCEPGRSPSLFFGMSNRLEYILHARTMSRLRSSMALDVLSLLLGLVAARGLVRERGRAGRRS